MTAKDFLRSIRSFHQKIDVVKGREGRLVTALDEFEEGLAAFADTGAPATSILFAEQINAIQKGILRIVTKWKNERQERVPVRALSDRYQDRPVIFVFGKVNSGKTTFMNLLIDELGQVGADMKGFVVMDGETISAELPFETGITETTSRIQGLKIDDCLMMIDSPGLHSVTESNEKLTRLYAGAADAIVWLSPSQSPGQTPELLDLKGELEQGKPLQPVLTRSDRVDEWLDANQDLQRKLRNKTTQTRRAQEDDLVERAQQLGVAKEIRPAVSISIEVYKKSRRSETDWENTGLATLFEKLIGIVDEARRYKVDEKATQELRKFINDKVLGELDDKIKPMLGDLVTESDRRIVHLNRKKPQISSDVKSRVMVAFEEIVDKHRSEENVDAISRDLEKVMIGLLTNVVRDELTEYGSFLEKKLASVEELVSVSANELGKFTKKTVEVEQEKRRAAREVGAAVGVAAFSLIPIPGARLIGPIVGGYVGRLIGGLLVKKHTVSLVVGNSAAALMENAERLVPGVINGVLGRLFDDLIEVHRSVIRYAKAMLSEIKRFKEDIRNEKPLQ